MCTRRVMILWRHLRTVEGWGSSVGFCIVDGRPVCLWPICRQTSRPTTSRHIYTIRRPSREETHTPAFNRRRRHHHHHGFCTRVYVYNSLSARVVKVSHLLAAVSLCTLRCMLRERVVFPALNFITCSRNIEGYSDALKSMTYDFIKSHCICRAHARLYLYACIHTSGQLLFRVRRPCFYEILGRRTEATRRSWPPPPAQGTLVPLSGRYACSLSRREMLTFKQRKSNWSSIYHDI